jgi:hypothetical protein
MSKARLAAISKRQMMIRSVYPFMRAINPRMTAPNNDTVSIRMNFS